MSTDLMNISAFKGVAPAAAFAGLDPNAESLADGIGSSYGIIGYKGKVWTLRLRGESHIFTRPDDGTPAAFLDVIVLRQLSNKSKSYYPKDTYQDGQIGTRPVCAALDGVAPDSDILTPQSNACATCERNVFKVSPDGRKTRECSDYKRLAVLVLPSMTRQILGAPLMEPVFLRVPAASLNDLALLGEGMAAQGFHFSTYITRIGFNPEKPHPQMTFRALQPLADREAAMVLPLRSDPTAIRITGENDIGKPRPVAQAYQVAGVVTPAAAATAPIQHVNPPVSNVIPLAAKPAVVVHPPAPVAAAPIDTGFGEPATAQAPVTVAVTPPVVAAAPVQTGLVDTGFGEPTAAPTATVATNTVADTGPAEDADLDLDARVAAILPK